MNPELVPRVARALYALPNALDQRMMAAVADALETSDSFEDLPDPVRRIVEHSEQYIGPFKGGGEDAAAGAGEVA